MHTSYVGYTMVLALCSSHGALHAMLYELLNFKLDLLQERNQANCGLPIPLRKDGIRFLNQFASEL